MRDASLRAVKERAADLLMTLPGVTGVGIGGRERGGAPTGELVLKVFVERKRPPAELAAGEILPTHFEGVAIDVSELGVGHLEVLAPAVQAAAPPGIVPGAPLTPDNDTDEERYRPLIGGGRVQSDLTGVGAGTLGCFLLHPTDPDKVYALTNYHVVVGKGKNRPDAVAGSTRAGQSEAKSRPTKCCSHMFGTYAAGRPLTVVRDAALIQLDAGMEYRKEIIDIGVVTGTHTITDAEVRTARYAVRKRGARTRLTGGVVEAIDTTHTIEDGIARNNVTVVRPNPNVAVRPGRPVYVSDGGDSGSVLVNDAGQVVTLHYAGIFVAAQKVNKSLSLPIEPILASFAAEGLPVVLAVGTTRVLVFTVPGATTVALPQEFVPALPGVRGAALLRPRGGGPARRNQGLRRLQPHPHPGRPHRRLVRHHPHHRPRRGLQRPGMGPPDRPPARRQCRMSLPTGTGGTWPVGGADPARARPMSTSEERLRRTTSGRGVHTDSAVSPLGSGRSRPPVTRTW